LTSDSRQITNLLARVFLNGERCVDAATDDRVMTPAREIAATDSISDVTHDGTGEVVDARVPVAGVACIPDAAAGALSGRDTRPARFREAVKSRRFKADRTDMDGESPSEKADEAPVRASGEYESRELAELLDGLVAGDAGDDEKTLTTLSDVPVEKVTFTRSADPENDPGSPDEPSR